MSIERKIHKVSVGVPQPVVVPRRGTLALRKSRLVRRRVRTLFYALGFVTSMAAISHASYGFLMEAPYFQIRQIKIEGVSEPVREEITGLIATIADGHYNILGLDNTDLTEQISRHPRVRDLRLDKVYPDTLLIRAVERKEAAILSTSKGMFLTDFDGFVMEELKAKDLASVQLPYISGLRAEEVYAGEAIDSSSLANAVTLLQVLKERNLPLYERVSEIEIQRDEVSPLENLTVHMKDGLAVKFGDGNPVDKLPSLETLLKKLNGDNIDPFKDLVYIDLRFANRAFYMDQQTALDLAMGEDHYNQIQQALEQETEKYEKENPSSADDDAPPAKSKSKQSSGSSKSAPSGKSSGRPTTPGASSQPAQNRTGATQQYPASNYQQSPQQYQQQYYQQRPTQQGAPVYNRPANTQRY